LIDATMRRRAWPKFWPGSSKPSGESLSSRASFPSHRRHGANDIHGNERGTARRLGNSSYAAFAMLAAARCEQALGNPSKQALHLTHAGLSPLSSPLAPPPHA